MYGRSNPLGMILGYKVLATLNALNRRLKLVGEPVAVADLLKLVRRAPDQACWHLEVRDLISDSKSVVHVKGADLPNHRRSTSCPLVIGPVLLYRFLRPLAVVMASVQKGAVDLTEDAVGQPLYCWAHRPHGIDARDRPGIVADGVHKNEAPHELRSAHG